MSKPSRRASRSAPSGTGAREAGATSATSSTGSTGSTTSGGSTRSTRPTSTRAGRRERPRTGYAKQSLLERYRTPLIAVAVVAVVGLIGMMAIQSASAKSYECTTGPWQPGATPSPEPSGTGELGLVQPDMGRNHIASTPTRYTYCPPASGAHFNLVDRGPIEPRAYGPDDPVQPAGWVHNLEHGALVLLYRGQEGDPGPTEDVQAQLRSYFGAFPDSPICGIPSGSIGPVIARFDDMNWPFAALVWGRVLPLETLDTELINRFWLQQGERTNPEPQCAPPTPSPAPSGSAPASVEPSAAASAEPSAPASVEPTATAAAS